MEGTTHKWDAAYPETDWTNAINAVNNGTIGTTYANPFHACDAFPYGVDEGGTTHYYVYDIYAGTSGYNANGGSLQGSNGHSFYGNVFGGGCGALVDTTNNQNPKANLLGIVGKTYVEISQATGVTTPPVITASV